MLFLSDLHLDATRPVHMEALDHVLNKAAHAGESIYILGDLVELWVGDDDDSEFATRLRSMLMQHSNRTEINLMHGNRDFLFGERFANETNVNLLPDPTVIQIGGNPVLLAHGDAYCTSDLEYQKMRSLFRSRQWQSSFLAESLSARHEFARNLRSQSAEANANKAENITDVVEQDVRDALSEFGCKTMLHGHTHRPGMHDLGDGRKRYVLGSWERCAWIGRATNDIQLECVSLSTGPL